MTITLFNLHQRQTGEKPKLSVELLGQNFGAAAGVTVEVKFIIDNGAATLNGNSVTLTPADPAGVSCAASNLTGLHQVQAVVGGNEVASTLVVTLDFHKAISPPDAPDPPWHRTRLKNQLPEAGLKPRAG